MDFAWDILYFNDIVFYNKKMKLRTGLTNIVLILISLLVAYYVYIWG